MYLKLCSSLIFTLHLHTLLLELKVYMNGQRVTTELTFPRSPGIRMGAGLGGAQLDLPSTKQMERQAHPSI